VQLDIYPVFVPEKASTPTRRRQPAAGTAARADGGSIKYKEGLHSLARPACQLPRSCVCADRPWRCRSSVAEHSLGKGKVVSPILTGSTSFFNGLSAPGRKRSRQNNGTNCRSVGESWGKLPHLASPGGRGRGPPIENPPEVRNQSYALAPSQKRVDRPPHRRRKLTLVARSPRTVQKLPWRYSSSQLPPSRQPLQLPLTVMLPHPIMGWSRQLSIPHGSAVAPGCRRWEPGECRRNSAPSGANGIFVANCINI
jgi:hypothetical protein